MRSWSPQPVFFGHGTSEVLPEATSEPLSRRPNLIVSVPVVLPRSVQYETYGMGVLKLGL